MSTGRDWSQWRGAAGDGHTQGLPKKWVEPKKLWRYPLPAQGIGGVAATEDFVVVSSRDASDQMDLFTMLDAESGIQIWQYSNPSELDLDYGNSARVTPLISDTSVFCLGADGMLACLDIESGEPIWQKHLVNDLMGKLPQWGFSVSPILIDDLLIVQPGGLEAAWVALDPTTGKIKWKTGGRASAYASPIVIERGGIKQLIGYDAISLGAWNIADGKRLWEMKPEVPKDFNVPSPLLVDNRIFVVTENNGARLYSIHDQDASGLKYDVTMDASTELLSGDSHTPVQVQSYIVGVDRDLVVLDPSKNLSEVARFEDVSLQKHCTLLVDHDRVWVSTASGTQLLLQISSKGVTELGRLQTMTEKGEIFSHPAICNGILYLRGPTWLDAYRLNSDNE